MLQAGDGTANVPGGKGITGLINMFKKLGPISVISPMTNMRRLSNGNIDFSTTHHLESQWWLRPSHKPRGTNGHTRIPGEGMQRQSCLPLSPGRQLPARGEAQALVMGCGSGEGAALVPVVRWH